MTEYNEVPEVGTGDAWSAAENNTFMRGNFNALWPFLAAGDIAYALSDSQLARLPKPLGKKRAYERQHRSCGMGEGERDAGSLARFGDRGFCARTDDLHYWPAWADITGATLTLSLVKQCTLFVMAAVTGRVTDATNYVPFQIRAVVNGTADAIFRVCSITAGHRTADRRPCHAFTWLQRSRQVRGL